MTRHEEIFAAVGAVKGMRLRGTSNEWLAAAWKVGEVGRLGRCRQWLLCIICLWAQKLFCAFGIATIRACYVKYANRWMTVVNFLARLAVFAFLQIP